MCTVLTAKAEFYCCKIRSSGIQWSHSDALGVKEELEDISSVTSDWIVNSSLFISILGLTSSLSLQEGGVVFLWPITREQHHFESTLMSCHANILFCPYSLWFCERVRGVRGGYDELCVVFAATEKKWNAATVSSCTLHSRVCPQCEKTRLAS